MDDGQKLLVLTEEEHEFLTSLVARFITLANASDQVALSLQMKVLHAFTIKNVDLLGRPAPAENQLDNDDSVPTIQE